jgi:hypothetical protein
MSRIHKILISKIKEQNMRNLIQLFIVILFINSNLSAQGAGMLLNYDGIDDFVRVDGVSSNVAGTEFTVEAWFRADSNFSAVFAFNQSSWDNRFLIYNQAVYDVNDGENRFYNNIPVVNEWNYLAVSLDTMNNLLRVYINGKEDIILETPTRVDSTDLASIGQEWDFGPQTSAHLNGSIDEVRISNTVLSLEEIRERMHRRLQDSSPGLVGYWRFDEGTGTSAGDSSGYGNDGLLLNGPAWDISTAPFGTGTADTKIINSTGQVFFEGTDLEYDITSKTGTDTLVVTKINNYPGGILPEESMFDEVYWIVEKYGEGSYQGELTFTFAEGILSTNQVFKLYTRPPRSDSGWSLISEASVISDTTLTFYDITEPGQFVITVDTATSVSSEYSTGPYEFSLMQNYPNPFNPTTSIQYALSSRQYVSLKVYDILGNEVTTLVNEYKPAGRYNVEFTIENEQLSSGVYFYKLTAGSYTAVKKMVLMK